MHNILLWFYSFLTFKVLTLYKYVTQFIIVYQLPIIRIYINIGYDI